MRRDMADGSDHKQDFAPPWLKFPSADPSKHNGVKPGSHQNRQRRDDPYFARPDFNSNYRLNRQNSLDCYEANKRFHPGQPKYRHHSVEDDYFNYPPNYYGYYPPAYSFDKFHYSSQPSLGRSINRDGKFFPPPPRPGPGMRRGGYPDKDHYRDGRGFDGKYRDHGSDRDRPFSDDFPSLVGNGEPNGEVKSSKPGSGVWDNPPKSSRNDDSSDLLKNSNPGIYKALVPNKNAASKKQNKDGVRMNGNVRDSSPLSPNNKKDSTRQSPTTDLGIVSQPKKLGDKKNEFFSALRKESSIRNGETFQDQNQNAVGKKPISRLGNESPMMEDMHINGNCGSDEVEEQGINGDCGETLASDVDHINLEEEDKEKRLLLSMGWVEGDDTEIITDDEKKEFMNLLRNHCQQNNGLKSSLRNVLNKNFADGLNGSNDSNDNKEAQSKPL